MPEIILIDMPPDGVFTEDADGAYFRAGTDHEAGSVQVLIKGAMQYKPGDYEEPVSARCGKPMKIIRSEFLPCYRPVSAEWAYQILRTGWVSLIFSEAS